GRTPRRGRPPRRDHRWRGRARAPEDDDGHHHHCRAAADPLGPRHRRERDEADRRADGRRDGLLDRADAGRDPGDLLALARAPARRGPRDRGGRPRRERGAARRRGGLMPGGGPPVVREPPPHNRTRRSSCAFTATITVLADIRIAPTAGCSRTPWLASTPAASGIATML